MLIVIWSSSIILSIKYQLFHLVSLLSMSILLASLRNSLYQAFELCIKTERLWSFSSNLICCHVVFWAFLNCSARLLSSLISFYSSTISKAVLIAFLSFMNRKACIAKLTIYPWQWIQYWTVSQYRYLWLVSAHETN